MTGSSDDRPEVEASAVDQVAPLQSAPPEATEVPDEARKRLPVGAYLAIGWLVFIIGAAIFADLLPLHDPAAEVASLPRLAPGQEGLILGADNGSRDMLSRTIYGARSSLMISVGAVSIGFVVGGLLGLLGGYFRNWIGKVLTSVFDILLAIPALVLALSLVSVLKGGGVEDPDAFGVEHVERCSRWSAEGGIGDDQVRLTADTGSARTGAAGVETT